MYVILYLYYCKSDSLPAYFVPARPEKSVCTAPTDASVLAVCSLAAFCGWCAAVAPLGRPHGPDERGRAVGRAIGALLWMQTGLLLLGLHPPFVAFAAALWALRYSIRALAPNITGS